jgi:hypothetical protein
MPVEGRSGGGLFSADGYVIGVCNCADPQDKEGLYAAGEVIRAELDRANFSFVYQDQPLNSTSGSGNQLIASASPPPEMPKQMPPPGDPVRPLSRVLQQTAVSLSRAELATLEEIMRRQATGAQIVCVVNPFANPAAKSQSVALDRSSSELLNRMAYELGTTAAEVVTIIRSPSNPGAKSEIIVLDRASAAFFGRLAAELNAAGGMSVARR